MSSQWTEGRFKARDGTSIAYRTAGAGRLVLLLHGFLANAQQNWIDPGVAGVLLDAGFRVLAPDLRGHGASEAPVDRAFWPKDILVQDQFDLIADLGLGDYDLVGYSLGARTAARMMVRGATPRRAVLGGMGSSGVMQAGARAELFEDAIRHGEKAQDPRAGRRIGVMMRQGGLNPDAMLGVLASFAATSSAELAAILTPTLVVCGTDDHDNGSPEDLAGMLINGRALRVPGDHMTAVSQPALAETITAFLTATTV